MSQHFFSIEHMFYFNSDSDSDPPDVESPPGADPFGFAKVQTLLASAIDVDPASVDDDALCSAMLSLEAVRKQLDALSSQLVIEAEVRNTTDSEHGLPTGPWLAREANLPRAMAKSRVKVAKRLRSHFGSALSALRDGRIGWDHARVLADAANPRIIDQLAAMCDQLIELAQHTTFEAWSREVRGIAELLDQDGGHRPGDDIEDNKLNLSGLFDNTIVISGQLCGELGLIFRDSIAAQADRIFARMTHDADTTGGELSVPSRATLQALALVELIRKGVAADTPRGKAPRAEVSLVVNAEEPGVVTDREGIPIGDTGRYACLCDPVFHPIVMNTRGIVTDLGRAQRLASDAQRKAMAHRDGGCVFPGCDAPPEWTDAHHTWHWEKGGLTDLALLASLCRHHHMVTHRAGWTMQATEDQWFYWTTPKGRTIWSQRHGRQYDGTTPPPLDDKAA